eukprot:11562067-Alexandrium_andersonii.AAC.1
MIWRQSQAASPRTLRRACRCAGRALPRAAAIASCSSANLASSMSWRGARVAQGDCLVLDGAVVVVQACG